jgi:5'-nucleotidase
MAPAGVAAGQATLTILHFNDVYNIEASSTEPAGGAARFVGLVRGAMGVHQRGGADAACRGRPPAPDLLAARPRAPPPPRRLPAPPTQIKSMAHLNPLVLFSGDAFNPSLMSTITLGKQMVPVLNAAGVAATCLGNHDLGAGSVGGPRVNGGGGVRS